MSGAFGLATFNIVQPVYAFGKINNLRAAAAHGTAVEEARVHQKATEVAMLVREAYYGYLLAASLEALALGIGAQLGGTLEKVQRQLDAGVAGVDNVDLLKLRTFRGQLEKQLNDIRQGKALALTGLRTLTGLEASLPIQLADARLQPVERQAPPLEESLGDAQRLRPEFVQAREGIQAFERLLAAAEADYYPLVFVGLFGSLAEATNRSRLSNPFLNDPLMDDVLAPVVGMRWHFDLGVTAAKVDEVAAELGQVQQQHALAEQGIPFQVRQAYLELEQHQANITATRKAFRSGPPVAGGGGGQLRPRCRRGQGRGRGRGGLRATARRLFRGRVQLQPQPRQARPPGRPRRGRGARAPAGVAAGALRHRRNKDMTMLGRWVVGVVVVGLLAGVAGAGEPLDRIRETVSDVLAVLEDETLQSPAEPDVAPGKAAPGGVPAVRL